MAVVGNRSLAPLVGALGRELAAPDGELLDRFLARRDEAAFTALVRRHGPMILAVCRRVLGGTADADDAFQATFLVLLRKGHALRSRATLGDWLHGVARRTALKARTAAARRRARERAAARHEDAPGDERNDWLPWLDEEIGRLPAKFREPLVLCDLEGRTRDEAARILGRPEGTVAGYLARGRALLVKRLLRRAALGAALGASPAGGTVYAVPPHLEDAVRAAALGAASPTVLALVGATRTLNPIAASLALIALVNFVGGLLAVGFLASVDLPAPPATPPGANTAPPTEPKGIGKPARAAGRVSDVRFSPDGARFVVVAGGTVSVHHTATRKVAFTVPGEAAGYTTDGNALLVLSEKVLRLDPGTGKIIQETPRPKAQAAWTRVSFGPDGGQFIAHDGERPRLFDTATGTEPYELGGKALVAGLRPASGQAAFFAPDGKHVFALPCFFGALTASGAGAWETRTGTLLAVTGGTGLVEPVFTAAAGNDALAVGYKDRVDVWAVTPDMGNERPARTLATAGPVTALALSKGRQLMAAGVREPVPGAGEAATTVVGHTSGVRLFDLRSGREVCRYDGFESARAHGALPVTALAFSPDGKHLLAGTGVHPVVELPHDAPAAGEFQVWAIPAPPAGAVPAPPAAGEPAVPTWTEKKVLQDPNVLVPAVVYAPIPRAAAAIGANGANLPPGGDTFATVGSNGIVSLWDRTTLTKLIDSIWLPGTGPACLAYSADGKYLAAGDSDGVVQYDAVTGKKVRAYTLGLMKQPVLAVAFSPDGKSLAQATGVTHAIHSLVTHESIENPGPAMTPAGLPEVPPVGIAWSPDGTLFARILNTPPGVEAGIKKWRVRVEGGRTGYKDMTGHDDMVTAIAWSKDGSVFASGDTGGVVVLWDGKTFKERHRTKLSSGDKGVTVHALAFAPDGKALATAVEAPGGGKGAIRVALLDPATGKETHQLTRPWTVPVVSLAWSRDGSTLLTACGLRPGDARHLAAEQKKAGGEIVVWERKP